MSLPVHNSLAPRDPQPSEFLAESLSVHDRECIGCQTHRRHVMVSFARKNDPVVYDLFLTREQATQLTVTLLDLVSSPVKGP